MVRRRDFFDEGGEFGFGTFDLGPSDLGSSNVLSDPQPFEETFPDFSGLREEERAGTLFGAIGQADLTPNERAFFERDQTNILSQFSGRLDKLLSEGKLATETFAEFVGQPDFFEEQFRERGPQDRAAPITRIIRR